MRPTSITLHRALDGATIVAFALAPFVLGLSGAPAVLAYVLAAVHLAMTAVTRFSPRTARPVSLPLHGAVECAVGIVLLALPWVLRWEGTPRLFYVVAGAVILAVWALSRYREPASQAG